MASGFMNYIDTAVTKESDLLGPGDILGLTRGVPKTRWNVALSQRVGRVGLLGRLNYYGSWVDHFDARFVRGPAAPVLDGRYIVDLEASIPLANEVTLVREAKAKAVLKKTGVGKPVHGLRRAGRGDQEAEGRADHGRDQGSGRYCQIELVTDRMVQ